MAKFSVPRFLQGVLAAAAGEQQGRQAAQQERQQLELSVAERMASLIPNALSLAREQREMRLEPFRAALGMPGLTPQSRQQLLSQYLAAAGEPSTVPANPDLLFRPFTGLSGPQGELFRRLMPSRPAPGQARPGVPAPSPSLPPLEFEGPYVEEARKSALERAADLQATALAQGNTELAGQLDTLIDRLHTRDIDPRSATGILKQAYSGIQAKTAAQGIAKRLNEAVDWLDTQLAKGTIPEQHVATASALAGELAALDPFTPEGPAQAAGLLRQFAEFRKTTSLQPSGAERLNAANAESVRRARLDQQNDRYLDSIRMARTPQQFLENVRLQRKWALENGYEPYGGEEFAERPGETPGEQKLRHLELAATYLEDPEAKRKAQRDLYKAYLSYLKSENYAALPEAQQQEFLDRTNALGEELGAPELPTLHPGVSPKVQALLEQRVLDRKLRKSLADRDFNLEQAKEAFRQKLANIRIGLESQRASISASKKSPLVQEIMAARMRVDNLEKHIQRLDLEETKSTDAKVKQQIRDKIAALVPHLNALMEEYRDIVARAELEWGKPPSSPVMPKASPKTGTGTAKSDLSPVEIEAIKGLQKHINPSTGKKFTYEEALNRVRARRKR